MGVTIGRPINGISINGLEFLLDDNGKARLFNNKEEAVTFLKEHGCSDEMIEDNFVFKEKPLELMCASINLNYFTKGQVYFAFDGSLESGVYVADDDNVTHFLSSEFIEQNFEVVTGYGY